MDKYIVGSMLRSLREKKKLTQLKLAEAINVSDKAISKWENGHGYPDISLIEPLANALGVSVIELFAGQDITNTNRSFNMLKLRFYVCPICGNIIAGAGEAVISCCGITLPALEAETADAAHRLKIERVEDEYYVTVPHEMSKTHYISFIAAVHDDGYEIKKLYPQSDAEARFKISGTNRFYFYCNRHGLFKA
ncbi:MAG: helix-turn-helix domain-containing protein [Clostridia bacterium]|nr:helix-turn-helix domain-containing protein [Clostridia bacterium]